MDPWGIEPQFPACDAGVFPLDEEPDATPADRRMIPDGLEPSLPRCERGVVAAGPRDQDGGASAGGGRQSARAPGLSFPPAADAPLSEVAEAGVEPANDITRLSTWPLSRFAYSAVKSRVQ